MSNSQKYPSPKKEDERFVCPICGNDYTYRQGYYRHFRNKHSDLVSENGKPEIKIKQISEKDIPKEEKLNEMYDAIRDMNQSLKSLDNSKRSIDFDIKGDYIAVLVISDLHYGNVNVNMDYVEKLLDFVKDYDRVFCVLNGDIIDYVTYCREAIQKTWLYRWTPKQIML